MSERSNETMSITLTVKRDYQVLWLKHVRGFDVGVHCAKCLRGAYNPLLAYRGKYQGQTLTTEIDPTTAPYFYLCGVTGRWADNLHIAWIHQPGSVIEYEEARIQIRITDAERIPILPLPEVVIQEQKLPREFHTCRNYQFGWHTFPEQREPK